jgi:DNA-binding transcriptional ArsR family regulator
MHPHNPAVRDVMTAEAPLQAEIVAGAPFELLIGLYATATPGARREPSWAPGSATECPPATRRAIEAVGDRAGEVWLHLLGLALELQQVEVDDFVATIEALDAVELRRHLLGVYVPSWRQLVGSNTLERAAVGDDDANTELLDNLRYYGGRARESLSQLLPLPPHETKVRIISALRLFGDEVFATARPTLIERLDQESRQKQTLKASVTVEELIDIAGQGYTYEREPEFGRVVLIPHFAARPWLLLCQHRDTRVICYSAADEELEPAQQREQRLLAVGRALGDPKRVGIILRLERGDATLQELADEIGLAKSTTHHHLGQLRAARLIALRGNAAGYRYTLDPTGFADAELVLGSFEFADYQPTGRRLPRPLR